VSDARADHVALRAATRRLAALTAGAVTVVLLLVGGLLLAVVSREQAAEAHTALRQAVLDADDLLSHPSTVGVWTQAADGTQRRSPSAPTWLPVAAAVGAVSSIDLGHTDERTVTRKGEDYRLLTVRDGHTVTQATTSTDPQSDEQHRLLTGLVVAEIVGLGLSVLLGGLLARRAMSPLVTAMDRQRRFVADASHELRTPLTLLSTRAQLLERSLRHRDATSDEHAESQALVADTRRLAEVVDDLLLSLADQPSRRETVDLVARARAAVAAAGPYAAEQGVQISGPGPGESPVTVMGAPGPLRRVLDALIDNAVAHTLAGGHVTVRVTAASKVTVQVVDDGTGIDPAVAPRLFDRFAHGPGTGGRRHFGLGLALVREVVQAHHGSVDAGPTPGGGATFTVTLPRTEAHQ
jgi:two-component system OmpR family sensor kinase